jgi:hypothetical protein
MKDLRADSDFGLVASSDTSCGGEADLVGFVSSLVVIVGVILEEDVAVDMIV